MADINGSFEVDGFVKQRKELEQLLMKNPAMEKKVQALIRKVLMEVRRNLGKTAQGTMMSDPRQTYKAVKTAVYKRILGGSVSILDKRKAGAPGNYQKPRKIREGQRGGNRITRSERTANLEGYQGADRGFILRFLNAGTDVRTSRYGNRGAILARNWFGPRSQQEMENAARNLQTMIDELIKKELR